MNRCAIGTINSAVDGLGSGSPIHPKSRIMLVQRGALSCEMRDGLWIVPPCSALWIPAGALCAIKAIGELKCCQVQIDPTLADPLPERCCVVAVTPLLRELLARVASLPLAYERVGANSRLVAVLVDELAAAQVERLHLPMPADMRLRGIVDLMMGNPADRATMGTWARRAGMSERSLLRRLSRETGMGFGRWRQQFNIVLAVEWLAGGASIQQVAADLGFKSAPSFVTMFHKALGAAPGRYMAERFAGCV
jgi:AraC-like DNA-binding protein